MRELRQEEEESGRRSPVSSDEKKLSRVFKVARKSKDSSDSESFEALETEPKRKFSVEDESSETELKIMSSVSSESCVTSTPSGTSTYDSDRVSISELLE